VSSKPKSMIQVMKDLYPQSGSRIKQWVVDKRRETQWENDTCPTSVTSEHRDNTDALCRNVPTAIWLALHQHDCCYVCNDQAERERRERCDVHNWLIDRGKRPPIEQDEDKLRDEEQPACPTLRVPRGRS
jgi:hypothetical protein